MPNDFSATPIVLRDGPPTYEELVTYYPSKFTWEQLKICVNAGDLRLLKRDKKLQARYDLWFQEIKKQYGSIENYLLKHRLQWGKPDTLTLLPSALPAQPTHNGHVNGANGDSSEPLPPLPADALPYFTADTPPEFISVIMNDWPYSLPSDVEHSLIWTRLPIFHPTLVHPSIAARVEKDGLWGFTGNIAPPSPSLLPTVLPLLAEWGLTRENLTISERGTDEEEERVRKVGEGAEQFVKRRWNEDEWETAWFVNPPRLQSVKGLAHIHVFARKKTV